MERRKHLKRPVWRRTRTLKWKARSILRRLRSDAKESPDEIVHHIMTCGEVMRVPPGAKWLKLDLRHEDDFAHYLVVDWQAFKEWLLMNFLEYRLYTQPRKGNDSWDADGRWTSRCPACGKEFVRIDAVDRFEFIDDPIEMAVVDVWKCLECGNCFVNKVSKHGAERPVSGSLRECQKWAYEFGLDAMPMDPHVEVVDEDWRPPMKEFLDSHRTDF